MSGLSRREKGFAYIALLVAISIMGIAMGSAARYWQNISLREKEEELLFRGQQYYLAIQRYYAALPHRPQYPVTVDDLMKDSRTPSGKRHLRQKFPDPITGNDFVLIQDQLSKRIIGVKSSSDKEPLKQANFPEEFKHFEGKTKYSDWQFLVQLPTSHPGRPGGMPPRPPFTSQPPGPKTH